MPPTAEHTSEAEVDQAIHTLATQERWPADWLATRHDREWPTWLDVVHAVVRGHHTVPNAGDTADVRARATADRWRFDVHQPVADARTGKPPLAPARVAQLAAYYQRITAQGVHVRPPESLEQALVAEAVADGRFRAPDLALVQPLVSQVLRPKGFGTCGLLRLWCVSTVNWPAARAAVLRAPAAALLHIDLEFDAGLAQVQELLQQALAPDAQFAVAWDLKPLHDPSRAAPQPLAAVAGNSATAGLAFGALWVLRRYLRRDAGWRDIADRLDHGDPSRIAISAALADGPRPDASSPAARWVLAPVGGIDDKGAALTPTLGQLPPGVGAPELYRCRRQPGLASADDALTAADLDELIAKVSERTGQLGGRPASQRLRRWLVDAPDDEPPDTELLAEVAHEAPPGPLGYLLQCWARYAGGEAGVLGAPVRLAEQFVRLRLRSEDHRVHATGRNSMDAAAKRDPDEWDFDGLPRLLNDARLKSVPAFSLEADPFTGKTTVLAQYTMHCAREALRAYARAWNWDGIEIAVLLPMNRLAPLLAGGAATPDSLMKWLQGQAIGLAAWLPAMADPHETAAAPGFKLRLLVDAVNELEVPDDDARRCVVQAVCDWLADLPRNRFMPPVLSVRAREKPMSFASRTRDWAARTVELQAWRADAMRTYIRRRFPGDQAAAQQLLRALDIDPEASDQELQELDLARNALAKFCSSPGILAAQCTLQQFWPQMSLPRNRADLLLALLWHCLAKRVSELKGPLLSGVMHAALADLDRLQGWLLPQDRGRLVDGMALHATAMQDAAGGMTELVRAQPALHALAERLKVDDAAVKQWLSAAQRIGWVQVVVEGQPPEAWLKFTHQQFQELCAALDLLPGQIADLAPPPLDPPDEAALLRRLEADREFRLELPAANRQLERVRLAAATGDAKAWIRHLMSHDLALAARVAADQRERIEGEFWESAWQRPHPVVQQLRRLLLVRAVDAGREVKERVGNSGLPGELLKSLGEPYDTEFAKTWAGAFQEGVDLRHRLEAGLLLGELGDTVRLDLVEAEGRRGLVLKKALWLDVSDAGEPMWHRIGDDQGENDEEEFRIKLDAFHLARLPVTVAEWRAFVEADGFDPEGEWWCEAGRRWLRRNGGRQRRPLTWGHSEYDNPLQAASGVTWFEAMAYARWARPLYAKVWGPGWELAIPDEMQWEAGVRHQQRADRARLRWSHPRGPQDSGALCLIHVPASWGRPSPAGVFSRGWTQLGVAEAATGGQWEWTSNVYSRPAYRTQNGRKLMHGEADGDDDASSRVLRGGEAFYGASVVRSRGRPSDCGGSLGLRLVLRRNPPHSGH